MEVLIVVEFERAFAAHEEGLARIDVEPLAAEFKG